MLQLPVQLSSIFLILSIIFSMLQKKNYNTQCSLPHKAITPKTYSPGYPYTQYPVPIGQSPGTSVHFSKNFNGEGQGMATSQSKFRRNPALGSLGKKINPNFYNQENLYSIAEAIRRHGMDYRRKLHNNYFANFHVSLMSPTAKTPLNQEKEMKNWYEERISGLHTKLDGYLKKLQKELGQEGFDRSNTSAMEKLFSAANKEWENELPQNLKKCFQL